MIEGNIEKKPFYTKYVQIYDLPGMTLSIIAVFIVGTTRIIQ